MGGAVLRFQPSFFSGSSLGFGSLTTSTRRFASGDQAKSDTPPLILVSGCASPPARFSNQTCEPCFFSVSSPRVVRNARYLLSGLHRGLLSLVSPVNVRRTCSEPSQLTIQMSVSRLSFSASTVPTVYATHFPSGDTCGSPTLLIFARSSTRIGRFADCACTEFAISKHATMPKLRVTCLIKTSAL